MIDQELHQGHDQPQAHPSKSMRHSGMSTARVNPFRRHGRHTWSRAAHPPCKLVCMIFSARRFISSRLTLTAYSSAGSVRMLSSPILTRPAPVRHLAAMRGQLRSDGRITRHVGQPRKPWDRLFASAETCSPSIPSGTSSFTPGGLAQAASATHGMCGVGSPRTAGHTWRR